MYQILDKYQEGDYYIGMEVNEMKNISDRIKITKDDGMRHLYKKGMGGIVTGLFGTDKDGDIYCVSFDDGFDSIVLGHHMKIVYRYR